MKVFPIALANHYALGTTTLSQAIRVVRSDGQVFAYTSAQTPVRIDGLVYERSGLNLSDVVTNMDGSVGNMELTTLDPDGVINRAEVFGGLWKNASFVIFEYNRQDPEGGQNPLVSGVFGEVTFHNNRVTIELRDLTQYLQQSVGEVTTKNCRNRLGDARCAVDLAPFTVTGTITHVTSNQVCRDDTRTEEDDWFGEGEFEFTNGPKAGFKTKVKAYTDDGTFTFMLPMWSAIEVGDEYRAVAGCRKRHDRTLDNPLGVSDCRDKFNNVLNFRGEPHLPGIDKITAEPDPVA